MIRTIDELSPQWQFIWTATGGSDICKHKYEEFDPIHEDEYTARYICVDCGAVLDYDVSDIGD